MESDRQFPHSAKFGIFVLCAIAAIGGLVTFQPFPAAGDAPSSTATYSHGVLHVSIPYDSARAGAGRLTMEVLDPEDKVLGRSERRMEAAAGHGQWQADTSLDKPLPLDDLVWHRVHYRFEYEDGKTA